MTMIARIRTKKDQKLIKYLSIIVLDMLDQSSCITYTWKLEIGVVDPLTIRLSPSPTTIHPPALSSTHQHSRPPTSILVHPPSPSPTHPPALTLTNQPYGFLITVSYSSLSIMYITYMLKLNNHNNNILLHHMTCK